jgi:hypothetical protein
VSLAQADRPIPDVLRFFAEFGIEVGLLIPTATGLTKSIMDAHASLRDFLKAKGIHDYDKQPQGPDSKRVVRAVLMTPLSIKESRVSLYRPVTKTGDPRIWISGLAEYAAPGNVLVLIADGDQLIVVNASDVSLLNTGRVSGTPLNDALRRLAADENPTAIELLEKLRDISSAGYVRTRRPGPTGVGFTLETLLGIKANSRKTPDFKGIEIKAGRATESGRPMVRTTLFSMAPDWSRSPYNALRLLKTYGRDNEEGRRQIYCTLDNVPNPTFGFYLQVEDAANELTSRKGTPRGTPARVDEKVLSWPLEELRTALRKKHRETFWVKAKTRGNGDSEEFYYYEVLHTTGPLPSNFAALIENGHVELDFLLSLKHAPNGRERARDHGYLFKIWERDRDLLFAPGKRYSLIA